VGSTESIGTVLITFLAVWLLLFLSLRVGRLIYMTYYERTYRDGFKVGSKDWRARVESLEGRVNDWDEKLESLHDHLASILSLRDKLAGAQENLFAIQRRHPTHKELDAGLYAELEDVYKMITTTKANLHKTQAMISKCQTERRNCVEELSRLAGG